MRASSILSTGVIAVALCGCNTAPTGPQITLGPDAPTTTDDLVATVTTEASDDQDDVKLIWAWSVRDLNGPDSFQARPEQVGPVVPSSATHKGQVWKVEVRATDGSLDSEPVTADITVVNTPPVVTLARLSPAAGVNTFGSLTATVAATDADDDEVDVDFTWYVDGTALDVRSAKLTSEYFTGGQEVWIEIVVSDGEAETEPVTSPKVLIDNLPPSLQGATISPEAPIESSVLSCEPVGWRDFDGDEPAVDIAWYVNATQVATTATLDGTAFDKGDLVRCRATPNDGTDVGPAVLSNAVRIGNSAPRIEGVVLNNTAPKAVDPLTYSLVGITDDDGDEISSTAEWFVDGELVASGVDTLPPRSFTKGQTIYAVVTPTDGFAVGDPVTSDTATGANTPPVLTSVSILPETIYTNTSLFPNIAVEDVDGDRLSYVVTWTVNGSAVSHTGVTLKGDTWFDKGDTVSVALVASDGTDSSASVSSSTYDVLNSPPSRPVVGFEADTVKDDADLVCVVEKASIDPDDDVLTTGFTWTRNGSAFTDVDTTTHTGDTVRADQTIDGDDFVCTYMVSDGDVTLSTTATILVRNWAGARVFTTCGNTGPYGPTYSDCASTYPGTNVDLDTWDVTSGGEQEWEVPEDGTYSITAYGSGGGVGSYAGAAPGGAKVYGEFDLTAGQVITLLVGQRGTANTYDSGGGGGTFVHDDSGSIMVIAGGGGASGYLGGTNCGGSDTTASRHPDSYSATTCSDSPVTAGYGGIDMDYFGSYSTYSFGSGGGGYYSGGRSVASGWGGKAYVDGAEGGYSGYNYGGFGGGGAGGYWYVPGGYSNPYGGGGGGGYTGGSGGYYSAGGGGSYNAGANKSATANANFEEGKVEIDKI